MVSLLPRFAGHARTSNSGLRVGTELAAAAVQESSCSNTTHKHSAAPSLVMVTHARFLKPADLAICTPWLLHVSLPFLYV